MCHQLRTDPATFSVYVALPERVLAVERFRRRLIKRKSTEGLPASTLWPHVIRVVAILAQLGEINRARLLRWVGHRTPAWWLQKVVALLEEEGLLERYETVGGNPTRPRRWYRIKIGAFAA